MKEQFQIHSIYKWNTSVVTTVVLVLLQTQIRVVKKEVVQLYYCPFPTFFKDKHPMTSKTSELVVALRFYSFCNDRRDNKI